MESVQLFETRLHWALSYSGHDEKQDDAKGTVSIKAPPRSRSKSDQVEVDGHSESPGKTLQAPLSPKLNLDELELLPKAKRLVLFWRLSLVSTPSVN